MGTTLQLMAREQDIKMQKDLARVMQEMEDLRKEFNEQREVLSLSAERIGWLEERVGVLEDENFALAEQVEIVKARTEPRRSNRLRGLGLGRRGGKGKEFLQAPR
jgi:hypothetical protein